MAIHKLSARKVATAGPGKHEDGGGLRLVVSNAGARKWVLRFTLHGRRREMGLGSYPVVSLAEARTKAVESLKQARQGIDPVSARRAKAEAIPTFTTCAARYIRTQRRSWKNAKHARQWVSTLKTYARPAIGAKRVDTIATDDVLRILSPIWNTKTETAKRVQGRIENVMDYAAAHKWHDPMNPARWRGHLDKILPKPTKVKVVRHHPAMPHENVPAFMADLAAKDGISSLALQFLILTATRTGEVLNATWDEIDLDAAVWVIPPHRMKAKAEHRVPLCDAALAVLHSLPRMADNPHVFPGSRPGRPLSAMALLKVMRGMGYGIGGGLGDYVPHGFRSSFRDWAGEVSSFPREVAEMALAHVIENKVEAAYRRGNLFEKRRRMMTEWADYVTAHQGGNVIPIKSRA